MEAAVSFKKYVESLCTHLEEMKVPKSVSKGRNKKFGASSPPYPPFCDYFLTTRVELSAEKLRAMESTLRTIRDEIDNLWSVLH
jgi:hypothetical protein